MKEEHNPKNINKGQGPTTPENITRKEAIKRMGKYAAVTALGTFIILNPKKAQAASPANPYEENPFG